MAPKEPTTIAPNKLRRLRKWCRALTARLRFSPNRSENGGALVEFTILVPVLFLVLFGITEWGMIFFLQNNMVNAAREGARSAAVQGLSAAAAKQAACTYLGGSGQTYTIVHTDYCTTAQDVRIDVSVDAAAASVTNYLGIFTGRTLKSTVLMRKETNCPTGGAGPTVSATCTCNANSATPTCS